MYATIAQPDPVPTNNTHIHDLVVGWLLSSPRPADRRIAHDVAARKQLGIQRYGTALQAGNGRDPLVDAYQEALDLLVYVEQAIEEGRVRAGVGEQYLRAVAVEPARALYDLLHPGAADAAV